MKLILLSLCFRFKTLNMEYLIEVENIKCSGCVKSINSSLLAIAGVKSVEVDIDKEIVAVEGEESTKTEVISKLASMGYPERGQNNLLNKAKSYVSCAIGKMKK
jgi:copper chaperone